MDGTRMGSRSSTRHGPASVYSGPVRRWKKSWAPITSSNPSPVASRILLYKWAPLATPNSGGKDENLEEINLRPARYIPVSVVIGQRKEVARKAAEEAEAAALAKLAGSQNIASSDSLPPDATESDVKESVATKDDDVQILGGTAAAAAAAAQVLPNTSDLNSVVEVPSSDVEMHLVSR